MTALDTPNSAFNTPGPWKLEGEGIKAMVRGDDATIVALRHRLPGVTNYWNMRLIAAAPDLLAALERVRDTYGFDPSIESSIWQEVNAAIKKANGR